MATISRWSIPGARRSPPARPPDRRMTIRRFPAFTALPLPAPSPSAQQNGRWTPRPIPDATEPSEVVANAPANAWRSIAPENLLVIHLQDGGRLIIELAPAFAPVHVANMRR